MVVRVMGLIMGLALPFAAAPAAMAQDLTRQLVVTGQGHALSAPDMAVIRLGVSHTAAGAQEAMDAVSEDVRALFQAVVENGVAPRDIQTTTLRLDPVRENRAADQQGPPEVIGFVATNEIELRLRAMTILGGVVQQLLDSCANRFSSIRFTLADPAPLQDQARRDAVADAMAKAALYSEAAGVTLGDVLMINESGTPSPRPLMMSEARMASDAMPVAGGEIDIVARVTMTFALQ